MHHDLVLTCLHCGMVVDAHSNPDPDLRPQDGNVDICFRCGGVSVYQVVDGKMTLRHPTDEETLSFETDDDLIAARKAIAIASTPQLAIELYGMMTGQIRD